MDTLPPTAARAAASAARTFPDTAAAFHRARAAAGGRLSAAQKEEIAGIVARIRQREANPPTTAEQIRPFGGTLTARLHERVCSAVLAAADTCGYRRSKSGWVGGAHRTTVSVGAYVCAQGASEKVWHKRHSWSGTDSAHTFTVKRDWLSRVQRAGLAVVDGLLTLDALQVAEGLWAADWVEQSTGFGLRAERGYIVRNRDGRLQHATSEAAARRLQAPAKPPRGAKAVALRAQELLRLPTDHWPSAGLSALVTAQDSLAAGNCAAGTRDWMARHLPEGQSAVSVAEALRVTDRNDFVRRACAWAIARAEAKTPAARKAA